MTQSTNARPCNCDQALKAEERATAAFALLDQVSKHAHSVLTRQQGLEREGLEDIEDMCRDALDNQPFPRKDPLDSVATKMLELQDRIEAHPSRAEAQLAAISLILCDLVSAPSLSVAQFADPTLERIRLAMLGRER